MFFIPEKVGAIYFRLKIKWQHHIHRNRKLILIIKIKTYSLISDCNKCSHSNVRFCKIRSSIVLEFMSKYQKMIEKKGLYYVSIVTLWKLISLLLWLLNLNLIRHPLIFKLRGGD